MPLLIDDKLIETPVIDLVNMLREKSLEKGGNKLDKLTVKGNNAMCCCPIHKNGREYRPSFSILLEDSADGHPAGSVHCFSCGYRGGFAKLVRDVLDVSYREAKDWIIDVSDYSICKNTRRFDLISHNDTATNNYDELPEITDEELKKYDNVCSYLLSRHISEKVIEKFEVGYDPEDKCVTFPVYVDGRCLFVAKRKVDYKKFFMPAVRPKPIYGLDYITGKEVFVCESIFNCLTLWGWGYQAIALFGTGSRENYEQLENLNVRAYILCFDGDRAGREGAWKFKINVRNHLICDVVMPEDRDVNDMTQEEFESIYNNFKGVYT